MSKPGTFLAIAAAAVGSFAVGYYFGHLQGRRKEIEENDYFFDENGDPICSCVCDGCPFENDCNYEDLGSDLDENESNKSLNDAVKASDANWADDEPEFDPNADVNWIVVDNQSDEESEDDEPDFDPEELASYFS